MAQQSSIEWTEATWNPVTGCSKVSTGCKHCYAERMALRLRAMGQPRYREGFALTLQPDLVDQPLSWRSPRVIFVNSMSDLFHEDISISFIGEVFSVIAKAHWHTFQVLTKRADRLEQIAGHLNWPVNLWMGVSVESEKYLWRIDCLRRIPAVIRFLSLEPLLGPLPGLDLTDIHWAIVGGESGPGARPMSSSWVRGVRDKCVAARVPFFFKQWGGVRKSKTGRKLDGKTWDQLPALLGRNRGVRQALPAMA